MKKKSAAKNKKSSKKLLRYLLFLFILVAIGVLLGVGLNFFFNSKETSQTQTSSSQTINSGGINFTANLPQDSVDAIANFLKTVYQDEYIPLDLEVKLVTQAEQSGDQYVGIWTASEKVFQVLLVTNNNTTTTRYLRTWALDTGADINQKLAETSITAYFRQDFIQSVGSLSCSEITDPESVDKGKITDCGSVKPDKEGGKVGISVRAPVAIQTGEEGTLSAACFVPKETAVGYLQKTCI